MTTTTAERAARAEALMSTQATAGSLAAAVRADISVGPRPVRAS
ncbi:hypothetical protein [Streptomyces sp. AM6-12]